MQVRRTISALVPRLVWLGPVALLLLLWLLAAFRAGGYQSQMWLPLALAVAFGGLVVAVIGAYSGPPSRRSLIVVLVFGCYVLWAALSTVWGMAPGLAWEEAARAGFYLVFFALALVYLTSAEVRPTGGSSAPGRNSAAGLLVVAGFAIFALASYRLATSPDLSSDFFVGRRFAFPLTNANSAGGFYLLLFWPLLWLAADPRVKLWLRATALGTMTALSQLALLTQSRGAFAALLIGGALYFILSPARLRSLVSLTIPAALFAASWAPLNAYYAEGALTVGGGRAVAYVGASWIGGAAAGLVLGLVDGRLRLSSRLRLALSLVIVVALLAGVAYGVTETRERAGGLSDWARGIASEFVGDDGRGEGASGETRFGQVGGNGRWDMWRTAWRGFTDAPVLGNGLGSYRYINERYRRLPSTDVRQSHSIELDVLSETGIVGLLLFLGTFGLALGAAVAPRLRSFWALFRRRRPLFLPLAEVEGTDVHANAVDQAWTVALLAGVLSWFAQASADWLWQFPGVTLGALLLLAWALSSAAAPGARRRSERRQRPEEGRSPAAGAAAFRVGLAVVSVAVLIGAGLPYLSLRYQDMALAGAAEDPTRALGHATLAGRLFPVSPEPLLVRADVFREVAAAQPAHEVEALALALVACENAVRKEDAASRVHLLAGQAALDLLAARASAGASPSRSAAGPESGSLSVIDGPLAWATPVESQAAEELLALPQAQLRARALTHLKAAQERNPLDSSLDELISAASEGLMEQGR